MALDKREMGKVVVLKVAGELDHAAMAEVKNAITELLGLEKTDVVLDLNEVETVSLMHLGLLVEEMRKLRKRGGDLKLVGMGKEVCMTFDRMGAGEWFCRFKSVKDALEDFKKKGGVS